jgi:hypothetical protein
MDLATWENLAVTGSRRLLEWVGLIFIFGVAYTHPWVKLTLMIVILTGAIYRIWRKGWPLALAFFITGGFLNLLAVAFNNGKMPEVGQRVDGTHQLLTSASHLQPLCDLYVAGTGFGWLQGSYSIGDMFALILFPAALVLEYFYFKYHPRKYEA